jgi:methionyl-tRNA formyltransferase
MRVVFCGSGRFAVATLQMLHRSDHVLAGAYTQPPRRAGRGSRTRPTPVAVEAGELGIEAVPCEDINALDVAAAVRAARPDVFVVADFGQMVGRPVRQAAALDAVNLHGSLLPALRGAAPINWAILGGLHTTGVTVISLVDRLDAGDIYAQAETPIRPETRADELRDELAALGAALMADTLGALERGTARRRPQNDEHATKAPALRKADGRIDWSADAVSIRNRIHGTWPWPGGQAVFRRADGRQVPVILARAAAEPGDAPPGELDGDLCTGTGDGRLRLLEIKPAGKRLMAWKDFVNGYRVRKGDRFLQSPA